jgi:hypothetical protein
LRRTRAYTKTQGKKKSDKQKIRNKKLGKKWWDSSYKPKKV